MLSTICAQLGASGSSSMLRTASRPLRDAHDACNRRLILGGGRGREAREARAGGMDVDLMIRMMQRTVQLDVLVVQPWISLPAALKLFKAPLPYDLASRLRELRLNAYVDIRILSELSVFAPTLQHLELGNCKRLSDIGPLTAFTALRHLVLSHCPRVESLQPLSSCISLQHLDLEACHQIKELDPLSSCTALIHVNLSDIRISKLDPLLACKELKYLDLKGCWNLKGAALAALVECTSITYLNIGDRCHISSLAGLERCTGLLHLDIHDNKDMANMGPLLECGAGLKLLDISECEGLTSAPSLSACSALTSLAANQCRGLQDLVGVIQSNALHSLSMNGCTQISSLMPMLALSAASLTTLGMSGLKGVQNFEPLQHCATLKYLDLSSCSISNLVPVSACIRLRTLNLSRCRKLHNLAHLSLLPELHTLSLSSNKHLNGSDITALAGCNWLVDLKMASIPGMVDLAFLTGYIRLEQLDISDSKVGCLVPLSSCAALQEINIKNCPVTDLSPLSACAALKRILLKASHEDRESVMNSGSARLASLVKKQ